MDFQREQILKQILNHKEVIKLINEHQITKSIIDREFLNLYSYVVNKNKCLNCKGLAFCQQDEVGKEPVLYYGLNFYTEYHPCVYLQEELKIQAKKANLISLACNLDDIDVTTLFTNSSRNDIYRKMKRIYQEYCAGKKPKGIYLHGSYGTGKTYIMGCFAKKYAENGNQVVFAYFPDLVRKIKSSIWTGELETLVDTLKYCDVLFLDDFGGETTTNFIRDEVLGAVFQERMENKSLTFITSNLDHTTLHQHLAETTKDIDDLKASRIEERIKTLMEFMQLKDENYRK